MQLSKEDDFENNKEKQQAIKEYEQQIDIMIYKLYDLTYSEVKIIDPEFPMSEEEYNNINGAISFDKLPEYINVHAKYNLPFNAFARPFEQNGLNPGLVMDLAQALKSDELNNIIDTRGNIINTNKLFSSKVLRIYHNSPMLSGIPLFALRKVLTNTRTMQVSR